MEIKKPFNLQNWINNNRHLLKPPVGNKNLYVDSGFHVIGMKAIDAPDLSIIKNEEPAA